jgi:diguanylate cyclase (GGDEF)-like protein
MHFTKAQKLNEWSAMMGRIYGDTQNYSKSEHEIHSHLTEVSGAFGKLLFKKNDYDGALEFLPKLFAWAIALFRKVKGPEADIEEALLIKYPRVCSYCMEAPCKCWFQEKPNVNVEQITRLFKLNAKTQRRSIDHFQMMFQSIYSESWELDPVTKEKISPKTSISIIYTRLIEELSEMAEAIRFNHLYPSNFNNELADYFAWWFALTCNFHLLYEDGRQMILAEELLWNSYPGFCLSCGLLPCDCRPGPVRELLSKPALSDLAFIDGLTQSENHASFNKTIDEMAKRFYPIALPIACIRIDVDDFKHFNNEMSHAAGDSALKNLTTTFRQKIRLRDRIFRVGNGDEFAILCQDLSDLEAEGMMLRVCEALKDKIVKGKNIEGKEYEKTITISVGITMCRDVTKLSEAFNIADEAAIQSKREGKNRITRKIYKD